MGYGLSRNVSGTEAIEFLNSYEGMIAEVSVYNGYGNDLTESNVYKTYRLDTGSGLPSFGCNNANVFVQVAYYGDYVDPNMKTNYTVDFNTAISTSARDFQVASNWDHLVDYDSYYDNHMSYSYSSSGGIESSGALLAYQQLDYDWGQQSSGKATYDLLVTPEVKGTVTLSVKKYNNNGYIEFYALSGNSGNWTRGDKIDYEFVGETTELSTTEWVTVKINVDEFAHVGIRGSYVYMDNFTAEQAIIMPERKIVIAYADPTATTGTIYWEQQANGKVLVKYDVKVVNTGEVDLTQGDEGFSVSIINNKTSEVLVTTPVPQDLAIGDTTDVFTVQVEVEPTLWPNTYTYINMNLRENLKNTILQRAQSTYKAYEPKFVFRAAESTATSSISTAEAWGTITESTTKSFEIANTGTAPLTIKSITLPEGFTSENVPVIPEGGLVIAKGGTQAFAITQNAAVTGTYAGTLTIVYLDKDDAEQTYTLAFSATVIGANTWTADFNNSTSTVVYPAGSVAESGIFKDYQYISSGNYNNWLVGSNSSSYASVNNKFITPKLHANAGDKLAFDVKAGYSSTDAYYVKVYVSNDRQTWGDPVETYVYSNTGSSFTTKTVSFDDTGDYYVAFAIYGSGSGIDNLVGLEKVDVAHDLYIKSISWPDASVKSGTALSKPSVDIIPLTDEAAENYTVKYIYGENEVEIASKALTTSANSTTSFAASFTPTVEATTTFPGTKVVFEFTDGTKFETETFDLTVTNEAIFHFQNAKYTSRWYEPSSDYTTPYSFGKTNNADSKTFWILNWGSAPLTVKSIVVPEGFTTSVSSMTLPAFDGTQDGLETCQQSFDVTFTATEAGTYSGNMVITYVNGAGEDATFELALSGTKLDPSKFYANFNNQEWPAGSIYQDNVSISYISTGDYGLLSSSSTKNLFITPKLTATEGENLQFDASTRNSYYDGTVKVYLSTDRETWGDPVKEIELSKTENTSKATYEYTFTTSGNYYVAFELNEARVDDIYGLTQVAVAHDMKIASSSVPEEGMQNITTTATVNVLNFGLADDNATVTVYVDGEAAATSEAVAVPMNHKFTDAGTQLSINFHSPKAGTFPVYLEVKNGDYTLTTEPVDVVFAEEKAKSDADMAVNGTTGEVPLNLNYKNSESVTMYNADALAAAGITPGAVIKKITYKGYKTSDEQTTSFQVYYKWTDDQTLSQPASTYPYAAEDNGMTNLINEDHTWAKVGSSSEMGDMIVLDFTENPITYESGKSLVVYMHSYVDGYKTAYFEKSTLSSDFCYARKQDAATLTNVFSKQVPAALHFTLEASTNTFAGTVKNAAGEAIEGATLTLVSRDGENIQYSGTTDAEGVYNISVIQSSRDYNVFIVADGYITKKAVALFTDGDFNKDFTMYESPLNNWENTNLASTEGWTAVASSGFRDYGKYQIGGEEFVRFAAPTADETHLNTEYAFGFECRWSSNFAAYTQESKNELPAGKYTLTFDVENVNAKTTSASYENRFTVTVGDQTFTDNSTEWMRGKSNWTEHSITFTVADPAKATLSFGYGTGSNNFGADNTPALYVSHLAMTFTSAVEVAIEALDAEIAKAESYKEGRTEGLAEYNDDIAIAKSYLTSDDADEINNAIEELQYAETLFLTANLPLAEGTYYVYNPLTEMFLSRGNAWGTSAVVDNYGVAINVAVADLPAGKYTLSSFDFGSTYGDDEWMYADAGGNRARNYTLTAVENGFTITNTNNSQFVYVYTKEDGNKYRVAGNAIKDDNYTDDAQTVWQFLTKAERDGIVADREEDAMIAAFDAAGVDQFITTMAGEATEVSFTSGNAWTQTVVREQGGQPATNANGTEMWQATGNYTQTIANLPSGLYKVSIQAFYRNGSSDEDQVRVATGYNTVLAYLEANGNKVQVKSWTSDKGDGNNPNSMTEAKAKFDEGKYVSEVYAFVGEDGNLNLKVDNPAHIGNGWFIVGSVKYQKIEEYVELTEDADGVMAMQDVTVGVERTFNAGWNAVVLPFALSADEVKAAFGVDGEGNATAQIAEFIGDELNGNDYVTVKFQTVEAIEAGKPYLIKLEAPVSGLKFRSKTLTDEVTATTTGTYYNFTGVYETTQVDEGDYFVKGGKLVKATANNSVKPFRSYLKAEAAAAGIRGLNFFFDEDEVTGINGMLVNRMATDDTYNVKGQKMEGKLRKDVYIQSGKKVVIK